MSSFFLVIVFLAGLIYLSMKYRPMMQNISVGKRMAAYLPSLLLAAGAMVVIYFGNNWIGRVFDNFYLIVFTQFFFVLILLSLCTYLIQALFKKAVDNSKKTA